MQPNSITSENRFNIQFQHLQSLESNCHNLQDYFKDNFVQSSMNRFKNLHKYRRLIKQNNLSFTQHQQILRSLIKTLTKRSSSHYFTYFIEYIEYFSGNFKEENKQQILQMLNYIIQKYSSKETKFSLQDLQNFVYHFKNMQWLIDNVWIYIKECIKKLKELNIPITQVVQEFYQKADKSNAKHQHILQKLEALKFQHVNTKIKIEKKNNIFVIKEICNWIERTKDNAKENNTLKEIQFLLKIKLVNFQNQKENNKKINNIKHIVESVHNSNFNINDQNQQEQNLSQKNFDYQDQPEDQLVEFIDSYDFYPRNIQFPKKAQITLNFIQENLQNLTLTKNQSEQYFEEEQPDIDQQENEEIYQNNEIYQLEIGGLFPEQQLQ